jgi:hypothetical protein
VPTTVPIPKGWLIAVGVGALFLVGEALSTLAAGLLLGPDSAAFAVRLWAAALIWLGVSNVAMLATPLYLAQRPRIVWAVRAVGVVFIALGLASLFWLSKDARVEPLLVWFGVYMAVTAIVGTFVIEWMVRRQVAA